MKIAIYSGSFNPIHNGHIAIAEAALAEGFDEVWLVVSPQNPHKSENELWPFEDRFRMVQLAIATNPALKASDCENQLPRPSYTIRTLEFLRENYPQHQFSLLIGGDNLAKFKLWKEYDKILDQFGLIVYPRSSVYDNPFKYHPNVCAIKAPLLEVSSTEIRKRLSENSTVSQLVPKVVENYLLQKWGTSPKGSGI